MDLTDAKAPRLIDCFRNGNIRLNVSNEENGFSLDSQKKLYQANTIMNTDCNASTTQVQSHDHMTEDCHGHDHDKCGHHHHAVEDTMLQSTDPVRISEYADEEEKSTIMYRDQIEDQSIRNQIPVKCTEIEVI